MLTVPNEEEESKVKRPLLSLIENIRRAEGAGSLYKPAEKQFCQPGLIKNVRTLADV